MEVREEDLLDVGKADRRALQLALRSLSAVEEQPLAAAAQRGAPRARAARSASKPRCRGRRGRGPRSAIVGSSAWPTPRQCSRSTGARSAGALHEDPGALQDALDRRGRRDLPGLISTLTPDCVYELVQSGHRWEGHEGAARFYTGLLTAFPDIRFDLTEHRHRAAGRLRGGRRHRHLRGAVARHAADRRAARVEGRRSGSRGTDERRLFGGERVYTAGLPLPPPAP